MFRIPLLFVTILFACHAVALERIVLSEDGKSFVLATSRQPFHPWGVNYGNEGRLMEDFWDADWKTFADDFREIKAMGGNVVRVHLQFGRFMDAADKPNAAALKQLARMLKLAEETEVYLDITGLACYRPKDVPPWYDPLDEKARWAAQAVFWKAVAETCAPSNAIFCYDLINEPVCPGNKVEKWYSGKLFGEYDFLQNITRDPAGRTRVEIVTAWIKTLRAAIREKDPQGLVTVGMLPWVNKWGHISGFSPKDIAPHLDYLSVHIYPNSADLTEAARAIKECDVGKAVVIEETFPLSCTIDELETFLKSTRGIATGWVFHYDGITIEEYEQQHGTEKWKPASAIWSAGLKSFVKLEAEMTK